MGYMDIFKFSQEEIRDLIISTLAIALIFAWYGRGIPHLDSWFGILFLISIFTVGSGFILHELAHRTVARHFGALSEFKAWYEGLAIALVLKIILGFTFIAPGAVYIYKDYLTSKENGLISLAGPLTNILLAFVFYMLHIPLISDLGFNVNLYLAAFNMIPVYPLDGSKIISWNPLVWGIISIPLFLWVLGLFNINLF
ncbi:zinc protease [Methanothermococcus okinawensis]|uniref:Peptidase M50 n=1 Tax=Methanothermococcus okinawensis (strain DSM 14208 / JCM 11175 / IH1) TaxID=647113 RepID=F8ALE5_METOI|nr:zinc protease [Methanothermococcus okinawensis]AEH06533.1 peptidase M50 [Methanothermococcus okinawensis IH1]